MYQKLKIKPIYDDFLKNVTLTDEQKRILDMWLNKDTILKISIDIGISERTVNYEIKKLKELFSDYYNLTIIKACLLVK